MSGCVNNVLPVVGDQLLIKLSHWATDLNLDTGDITEPPFQGCGKLLKEVKGQRLAEDQMKLPHP